MKEGMVEVVVGYKECMCFQSYGMGVDTRPKGERNFHKRGQRLQGE